MILTTTDIDQLAQVGLEAALAAGKHIASETDKQHTAGHKTGHNSLASQVVTDVDIKSQEIILAALEDSIGRFDLGLMSEEMQDNESRLAKDYFWCIDPLDGTLPFTEQRAGYAVSVALISKEGEPIIGIVIDPYSQSHYVAVNGRGCQRNGQLFQWDPILTDELICYFDRSFLLSKEYDSTMERLHSIKEKFGLSDLKTRVGAGAVMNAIGLLESRHACYIKLPKAAKGGGCIWDFASTNLIFQELRLHVSDSFGKTMQLNKKDSVYMNRDGVLFATDSTLGNELVHLNSNRL